MRGRGVAELAATVRATTVVQCSGTDVAAFWQAMGFALTHEMVQDGHIFALQQRGITLNVSLFSHRTFNYMSGSRHCIHPD